MLGAIVVLSGVVHAVHKTPEEIHQEVVAEARKQSNEVEKLYHDTCMDKDTRDDECIQLMGNTSIRGSAPDWSKA